MLWANYIFTMLTCNLIILYECSAVVISHNLIHKYIVN